jgi:hypothetical protein
MTLAPLVAEAQARLDALRTLIEAVGEDNKNVDGGCGC